jgi:hypothetical protein
MVQRSHRDRSARRADVKTQLWLDKMSRLKFSFAKQLNSSATMCEGDPPSRWSCLKLAQHYLVRLQKSILLQWLSFPDHENYIVSYYILAWFSPCQSGTRCLNLCDRVTETSSNLCLCVAETAAALQVGTITTPLSPVLSEKIMKVLLLASELNQDPLHGICLGIIHKLVCRSMPQQYTGAYACQSFKCCRLI